MTAYTLRLAIARTPLQKAGGVVRSMYSSSVLVDLILPPLKPNLGDKRGGLVVIGVLPADHPWTHTLARVGPRSYSACTPLLLVCYDEELASSRPLSHTKIPAPGNSSPCDGSACGGTA
jgi:hypothetical protein